MAILGSKPFLNFAEHVQSVIFVLWHGVTKNYIKKINCNSVVLPVNIPLNLMAPKGPNKLWWKNNSHGQNLLNSNVAQAGKALMKFIMWLPCNKLVTLFSIYCYGSEHGTCRSLVWVNVSLNRPGYVLYLDSSVPVAQGNVWCYDVIGYHDIISMLTLLLLPNMKVVGAWVCTQQLARQFYPPDCWEGACFL